MNQLQRLIDIRDVAAERHRRRPRPCLQGLEEALWHEFEIADHALSTAFAEFWASGNIELKREKGKGGVVMDIGQACDNARRDVREKQIRADERAKIIAEIREMSNESYLISWTNDCKRITDRLEGKEGLCRTV